MKRKRSIKTELADDSDTSLIKSHPLFPFILQKICGEAVHNVPEQFFSKTGRSHRDQVTRILLDLLKVLKLYNNDTKSSELSVELEEQFINSGLKSKWKSDCYPAGQLFTKDIDIERKAQKRIKLPPDSISPVIGKHPRKPTDFMRSRLSKMVCAQSEEVSFDGSPRLLEESRILPTLQTVQSKHLIDVHEVKAHPLEDETDDVINHQLFPYVLRAINDTKGTNLPYIPLLKEDPGTDKFVTAVLTDLLKLLEKRTIEKRRVLEKIKTVSTSVKAYLDVESAFGTPS